MYDYTGSGVETTHPALLSRFTYGIERDAAGQPYPSHARMPGIPRLSTPSLGGKPVRRRLDAQTTSGQDASGNGSSNAGLPNGTQVPTFPDGSFSGFSPQQWNAIDQAVQDAVACVHGGGCTAGEIDQRIMSSLQATNLFTSGELAIISQGASNAEGHGSGFKEQANGSTTPFYTNWFNHIAASVSSWLQSAPPPGTQTSPGAAATDPVLSALLGAVGGTTSGSGSGTANPSADPTTGQYAVAPAPSSPMLPLLLLAGAGGLVWYWNKNRHKGGAKE